MDVASKVNRERVVVLGWGRAILLQLAHPLVAAGVAGHTHFTAGRLGRLRRLRATVDAMRAFTFGDARRVIAAAARINAIHDRVHGRLRAGAGGFPAGTPYSATDPDLLLWVHVTLLESVPLAFERFVGPLTAAEKDAYCAQSAATARLLRIPDDRLPVTSRQLEGVMDRVRTSGHLEVTAEARAVAHDLLYPPLTDPTRPGAWLNRLVTLGLLPPDIREAYGFPWGRRHERGFRVVTAALRTAWPLLPAPVRHWHDARTG
jgi:uncharacterized protein (DUF2236 family)